jgi:hypothetical protein
MILEVALLNIRPGASADFERAFAEAQAISVARAGYGWVKRISGYGQSTDAQSDTLRGSETDTGARLFLLT